MGQGRLGVGGVSAVAAAALLVGLVAGGRGIPQVQDAAGPGGGLDDVAGLIREHAVVEPDAQRLREGAINGMLQALGDPWAEYDPASGSVSEGEEASGADLPLHVTAEFLPDGVRYVAIDSFAEGVGEQVGNALAGSKSGIILDLRGNAGGLLDEAVAVASHVLDGGIVASFTPRGEAVKRYLAVPGGDTTTPMVVLVDALTASSAEALAAALKERGRAVIVGQRTFGKGTVQEPFVLADGSRLKITIGTLSTPTGGAINGVGVVPDVEVNTEDARIRGLSILASLIDGRR